MLQGPNLGLGLGLLLNHLNQDLSCHSNCTAWKVGNAPVYKAVPDIAGPGLCLPASYWTMLLSYRDADTCCIYSE